MRNQKDSPISPLVDRWLPEASEEDRVAAQRTLDELVACFYRICERIQQERRDASRQKESVRYLEGGGEKNS